MRAFEIIHANCHGCLPSFVKQGTQLVRFSYKLYQLPFAVCMGVSPQHNHKHKRLFGPLLYYTREAGSACAVKTINSCHEYPKQRGCAVMAFTAEEVIRVLNDTYEDNSDDE